MNQPKPVDATLRVDAETVAFMSEHGLVDNAEDPARARVTQKGLNLIAVCTAFLSTEIEGSVEAPTWQFQGLQAFLAVVLGKMAENEAGGHLPHDGETQRG